MAFYIEPPERLQWFAIDLDNTIAEDIWPEQGIGEPIDSGVDKLIQVKRAGYKIMIWTARHWGDYGMIKAWLEEYNIPYDMIVCGKPLVHSFVDDRAINANEEEWI